MTNPLKALITFQVRLFAVLFICWLSLAWAQDAAVTEFREVALTFNQEAVAVSATYPFFLDPAMQAVNNTVQQEEMDASSWFLREGQSAALEGYLTIPWELERSVASEYVAADFVSLSVNTYSYAGGAHPNVFFSTYNFSVNDGETTRLALADFFAPGSNYLELLNGHIASDLTAQEASRALDNELRLSEEELADVYANAEGLQFMFAPYAVGAYVEGAFFVTVPYDVLAPIIHEESPLSRFLN